MVLEQTVDAEAKSSVLGSYGDGLLRLYTRINAATRSGDVAGGCRPPEKMQEAMTIRSQVDPAQRRREAKRRVPGARPGAESSFVQVAAKRGRGRAALQPPSPRPAAAVAADG